MVMMIRFVIVVIVIIIIIIIIIIYCIVALLLLSDNQRERVKTYEGFMERVARSRGPMERPSKKAKLKTIAMRLNISCFQ